jgi:tetratricopeptide (TPR) repeat protein
MNTPHESPEAQDLLRAAMAAEAAGDADQATLLLRQSVAQQPVNPVAHYLLGVDCAQRGQHGDAVLHLTLTVEQAPDLWEARLQLGLLWLLLGNPGSASAALQPLVNTLPDAAALHHFGAALLAMAADRTEDACAALQRGLQIGCDNAPLMADMRRLLQQLSSASGPASEADRIALQHGIAISAYAGGGTAR